MPVRQYVIFYDDRSQLCKHCVLICKCTCILVIYRYIVCTAKVRNSVTAICCILLFECLPFKIELIGKLKQHAGMSAKIQYSTRNKELHQHVLVKDKRVQIEENMQTQNTEVTFTEFQVTLVQKVVLWGEVGKHFQCTIN